MTDETDRLIAALDRALALRRAWHTANIGASRAQGAAERARARYESAVADLENLHEFITAAAQGNIP